MIESEDRTYTQLIESLADSHPTPAVFRKEAELDRIERLSHWQSGVRLRGYEDLVSHLPKVAQVYRRNRKLRSIAFLIDRAQADFVTALEATLSGFHKVAHDAMRDVMEIEFLLRDFYYDPDHIKEWLAASPQKRNLKFRPAVLRQRHANRLNVRPQDVLEATDYKENSMYLHVSPTQNPFGKPGLNRGNIAFSAKQRLLGNFRA